jgi:hypothetical protein
MCDDWRNSFKSFIRDMGRKPGMDYTLERIDNDGPYAPENCRWATRHDQMRNMTRNVWLTHPDGRRMIMSDWARILGINPSTLQQRWIHGWSDQAIVTTPRLKSRYHR